jgi:hypothetical protein
MDQNLKAKFIRQGNGWQLVGREQSGFALDTFDE